MHFASEADTRPERWSVVLRALREAAGASQEGWAARLSVGRSTLQRWESGDTPPSPDAEAVLLEGCRDRGLFRTFYQGPLRGLTITAELIPDLLAEARVAGTPDRARRVTRLIQASPRTSIPRTTRPSSPRTSFIGRERDLAEVQRLLGTSRLVSLTGPGGAGKSRLALQILDGAASTEDAWLLDLSALSDAELIPTALAGALAVRDDAQQPPLDAAIERLASSGGLLVIDNCEHLLVASAHLVDRLLAECPALHVLTTTR